MITGFNTDIEFNGRVYHVQTEDRGLDNPIVESLVYSGGEIVTARKTSYAELIESDTYTEGQVLTRMEVQHRDLIREIRNGEFDKDGLKPFGHGIVTNRTLDEVVGEQLCGPEFRDLSMGMSNDLEHGIEFGATIVRVGSALFEGIEVGPEPVEVD